MNAWVGRFHYLDQLIMAQLSEDWVHDFDDGWEAAEAFIVEADDEYLLNIKTNIATLRQAYPSPEARFDLYHLRGVFRNSAGFQMWLTDLDRRITQAIAGIHNEPMVDPRPPLQPDGGNDTAAWTP